MLPLDGELPIGSPLALDELAVVGVLACQGVDHTPMANNAHRVFRPASQLLLQRSDGIALGLRHISGLESHLKTADVASTRKRLEQ